MELVPKGTLGKTLSSTEAPVTSNRVNFLQPRHDLVPSRDRLGYQQVCSAEKSAWMALKIAGNGRISRFLLSNRTGESVLLIATRKLAGLFSGGHRSSPVSKVACGECNAITSR